ncbi:SseB family protein [Microbacterium sp. gxy059]|uniref:SseB family protein n=1 Tax=Microbacterium sp. gxy059 TaxID=2957199 RepID=UPI003D99BC8B
MTSEATPAPVQNTRVQEALATWAERKDPQTHSEVLRTAFAGQLLLDITGSEIADPQHPLQEGDRLVVTSVSDGEEKDLLLAFTDNARLAAYSQHEDPLSLAQPAAGALTQSREHHDGIAIDAGTPGAFVAYADEIQRAAGDDPASAARIATALVDGGVQIDEFVRILREGVVYVGGQPVTDDDGDTIGYSVLTATRPDGARLHALFSCPAEVWALAPDAVAQPATLDRVIDSAAEGEMSGIVVNPAGPAAELPLDWFERGDG